MIEQGVALTGGDDDDFHRGGGRLRVGVTGFSGEVEAGDRGGSMMIPEALPLSLVGLRSIMGEDQG